MNPEAWLSTLIAEKMIASLIFIASFFIGQIFHLREENMAMMRHLLWIAAAFSAFSWVCNVFKGVARGLQLYQWESSVNIVTLLLSTVLIVWIVNHGYGVIGLMLVSQGVTLISGLIFYFISRPRIGQLRLNPLCFLHPTFRTLFSFSIYIFLSSLFDILIFQADYVVIGLFLSPVAVTIYGIAFSIQQQIRSISPILIEPVFPLSAELEGAGEYEKQKLLLLNGTKFSTLVFIPLVLIAIIFMRPFIINWMGNDFSASVLPAQVLLFWWLFNPYNNLGGIILTAKGLVKKLFWINALNGVLNLILSLILVNFVGILGVALGTTLPMILIAFPLLFRLILRALRVSVSEFYQTTIAPNLRTYLITILLSVCALAVYYPKNLIVTLVEIGTTYVMVLTFTYFFILKPEEKKQLQRIGGW